MVNRYLAQIEKKADVARDFVSTSLYREDERRRPYAHVSPEMAQALETAALSGGTYLAAKGLGKVNPGIGEAAPYLAGAAGLVSLTHFGKKVDANLRTGINQHSAMIRNQARADAETHRKQAEEIEHNYKPALAAGAMDAGMGIGFGALGHQISKRFFKGKYAPGIIGGLEGASAMVATDLYQRHHEKELANLKKQASFTAAATLFGLRKAAPKLAKKFAPKTMGSEFAAGMKGGVAKQGPVSSFISHGFTPGVGAARQQASGHGSALMKKLQDSGYTGSVDNVFVRGASRPTPHPGLTPDQQQIVRQHMKGFDGQIKLPSLPSTVQVAEKAAPTTANKALAGVADLGAGSYFSGATSLVEAAGHGTKSLAQSLQSSSNKLLNRIGRGMERRGKQTTGFGHRMDHAEPKVLAGEGVGATLQSLGHFF